MNTLRMKPDRSLYFQDVLRPGAPGPGQILVKMRYASICDYDMMILRGAAAREPSGFVGHEGSGIVAAVGEDVTELKPGDRVTMEDTRPCGICEACCSNRKEYCINIQSNAYSMSEYVLFNQSMVYRLPDSQSLKEGCLIKPLTMAMHAVTKANLSYGKNVILLGCGGKGQIILKLIRQHPVGKIVVVEPEAEKRKAALRFGADVVLNPYAGNMITEALMQTGGQGYDAVFEITGNSNAVKNAFNLVSRGGSVVYYALYGAEFTLSVNLMSLFWKDAALSAVGVPSGQFPSALNMAGRLNLEEVITSVYPFDRAIEAFEAKAKGGQAKVMLEFPE